MDFREDGKNEEGKLFGECLVKRERGENYGGIQVFFFLDPPKSLLSKMRRKMDEGKFNGK